MGASRANTPAHPSVQLEEALHLFGAGLPMGWEAKPNVLPHRE